VAQNGPVYSANQVFCDGNIKGNIEASGLVALNQTAEVMGNIHAQSLRIQDNAVIKGNIDIFRDEKRKDEGQGITEKPKEEASL
jgi:cytoskeletal protein CcmA (bactofilin family)